jgi:hypothetical protein
MRRFALDEGTMDNASRSSRADLAAGTGERSRRGLPVSRTNVSLISRFRRVPVRATVVLVDGAGNRATRNVSFTLRPAR